MALTQVTSSMLESTAQYMGMKNRIINGAMVIDQRNAGASVTPTVDGTYTLDRMQVYISAASKFSVQRDSTVYPAGFTNSAKITSLAATSLSSGDYYCFVQPIEGFNVADLGFGAAGAATVTVSFWVRSSLTGTFGGALRNGAANRSYPFTYTISSANTWEQKLVTIVGDTTGTWATGNTQGMAVIFGLGVGTTNSGTANAWAGSGYISATGATSVVGTSGATFYITGVQLEKGSTATSFDYRPYGTEFDLCRRYCEVYSGTAEQAIPQYLGNVDVSNRPEIFLTYYPKRAAPTVTVASGTAFDWLSSANTVVQTSAYNGTSIGSGINGAIMFFSTASGVTAGTLSGTGCISFRTTNSITVSAEL